MGAPEALFAAPLPLLEGMPFTLVFAVPLHLEIGTRGAFLAVPMAHLEKGLEPSSGPLANATGPRRTSR